MKQTFMTLAMITFVVWGGSNLWLAGYEQGYEQGEEYAWNRAHATFRGLSHAYQYGKRSPHWPNPPQIQIESLEAELSNASLTTVESRTAVATVKAK